MLRMTVLLLAALCALGCGGGGGVGEACDTPGETESECDDGAICDKPTDEEDPVCLKVCEEHEDCAADERCNGVSSSNIKACHPDDGDGDDGVDLDGDGGKK